MKSKICAFFWILIFSSTALADFTLTTWNVKHLGRKSFDTARAALILAKSDMILSDHSPVSVVIRLGDP